MTHKHEHDDWERFMHCGNCLDSKRPSWMVEIRIDRTKKRAFLTCAICEKEMGSLELTDETIDRLFAMKCPECEKEENVVK